MRSFRVTKPNRVHGPPMLTVSFLRWLDLQAARDTGPCLPIAVDPRFRRLPREGTHQTPRCACRPCRRRDRFRPRRSTSKQAVRLVSRRHGSGCRKAIRRRHALVHAKAAARAAGIALPRLTLPYALFPVLQARPRRGNSGVALTVAPPATCARFGSIGRSRRRRQGCGSRLASSSHSGPGARFNRSAAGGSGSRPTRRCP